MPSTQYRIMYELPVCSDGMTEAPARQQVIIEACSARLCSFVEHEPQLLRGIRHREVRDVPCLDDLDAGFGRTEFPCVASREVSSNFLTVLLC